MQPPSRRLAAVIVEVPPAPWGADESGGFLQWVEDLSRQQGVLFVLDEIVTGCRYHLGGAQALYEVRPDLACFSKAMGNGHAVAALVGRQDLMREFGRGHLFFSTTFGGETIGLAAAKATLETLRETDALLQLIARGTALGVGLSRVMQQSVLPATLWGNHARLHIRWETVPGVATAAELKTLWLQESIRRGVLHGPGVIFPMVCYTAHDVEVLVHVAAEVACIIRQALDTDRVHESIEGVAVTDVFDRRYTPVPGLR